jgi:hypothetical protein
MGVGSASWTPVSATVHAGDFSITANTCSAGPSCARQETTAAIGGWHVTVHR